MKDVYNPYDKYGLRRVINAATSLTRLGGSIASKEVFTVMEDASKSFIQIPELQAWAGKKIAEVTGAEAGLPTSGASNGLMLAAAACIMKGTDLEKYDPLELEKWTKFVQKLPAHTEGLRTEFIVQKNNRNIYDHAIECVGGRFKEVGTEEGTTEKELNKAFDPEKTAAYYFTVRSSHASLPLDLIINVAHRNNVPIIVDAAAELPPKQKLNQYIEKGADLVIFSGGKEIAGPNNSGILVGRKDLIKLAHLQAYPFHGIGRASKMSRETIVGLVKALEVFMEKDEKIRFEELKKKADWIREQLCVINGVTSEICYQRTVEEKEPVTPICCIKIDESIFDINGRELVKRLREGDPSIETLYEPDYLLEDYKNKVTINPEFMLSGDEKTVVKKIKEILKT